MDKINSNGIDPVTIMAENDLKIQFTRREKQAPAREQDEGETQYKNRLINVSFRNQNIANTVKVGNKLIL